MNTLLTGCRAVYSPVSCDGAFPAPLVGDGPRLRNWRSTNEFYNAAPTLGSSIGPVWSFTTPGAGLWSYIPHGWRGPTNDRLWRFGTGATVLWYGVPTGTGGSWSGLAGLMYDGVDSTPWGLLSLRRSNGGFFCFQSNDQGTQYLERLSSVTVASRVGLPTVVIGVIRPSVGGLARMEISVAGTLNRSASDLAVKPGVPSSHQPLIYMGHNTGPQASSSIPNHHTRLFGLWDRALSLGEMEGLTRDPLVLERTALLRSRQKATSLPFRTLRPVRDISAIGWRAG